MQKLGLTGGIGAGKSYIAQILRKRGIPVYDSDKEAKRLLNEHSGIRADLTALLGEHIYVHGAIDKVALADYLFASPQHTQQINGIIHPRVKEDFLQWVEEQRRLGITRVALESAILFESGFHQLVDKVLVVTAPLEVRIARVMQRDGTERQKIEKRMLAQLSDEERTKQADILIVNDGRMSAMELESKIFLDIETLFSTKKLV